MNKMLVVIFDTELAADTGLHALRKLHTEGDITLYATAVVACAADGKLTVKQATGPGSSDVGVGMAVGGLIGLLAGPGGLLVGAMAGTLVGAVRDYWMAGVGLDFIEETEKSLKPGKVALVAEIEEEWVVPLDVALEATGGVVYRRTRSDLAEAQLDHDITAFKSEIRSLESETAHAGNSAKSRLEAKLAAAKTRLDGAITRAKQRVAALEQEADSKAQAVKAQLSEVQGDVKGKIEERMKRVKGAYHARGSKLAQAWTLTKEALAV